MSLPCLLSFSRWHLTQNTVQASWTHEALYDLDPVTSPTSGSLTLLRSFPSILCYVHFQGCCVFSCPYSCTFAELSAWKIPQLEWCINPFFSNPRLFSACLWCCNFCFTHLSFSIDCECLEGKAISHLTPVPPMPSVNNTERMSRWWRVKMSIFVLTIHSARSC